MKAAILCLAMVASFFTQALFACSCRQAPDIETGVPVAVEYADVVFLAEAVSIDKDRVSEFETYDTTTFALQSVWKGDLGKTVTTRVMTTCCLCGFRFTAGQTYLVYGKRGGNGQYTVSTCSRTKNRQHAEDELRFLQAHY